MRDLKARAQRLQATVMFGKQGLTPEFLAGFNQSLDVHQLVKIKFVHHKEERKELSRKLAEASNSQLIQQVGHVAVFYRQQQETQAAAVEP